MRYKPYIIIMRRIVDTYHPLLKDELFNIDNFPLNPPKFQKINNDLYLREITLSSGLAPVYIVSDNHPMFNFDVFVEDSGQLGEFATEEAIEEPGFNTYSGITATGDSQIHTIHIINKSIFDRIDDEYGLVDKQIEYLNRYCKKPETLPNILPVFDHHFKNEIVWPQID